MIRRTYSCSDCALEWTVSHVHSEEPVPDCPVCNVLATREFKPVATLTNKSKAIDYVQDMVEQDYGLTDFSDNQRKGDIAFKGPAPMQTAEREAITRELAAFGLPPELTPDQAKMAAGFWGNGSPAPTGNPVVDQVLQSAVHVAPAASAVARREGVDPVGLMHDAGTKGMLNMKLNVAARGEMVKQ